MPKKKAAKNNNKKPAAGARKPTAKDKQAVGSRWPGLLGWMAASLFLLFVLYLVYLDRQVVERFETRLWSVPAKVYSRPLELYVGKSLSSAQLQYELDLLGYTRTDSIPVNPGSVHHWNKQWDIMTRGYRFWDSADDAVRARITLEAGKLVSLTSLSNGENLDLLRLEPAYIDGIFPKHGEDRVLVTLEEVPDALITMLLMTEDRKFFDHHGIDPPAILRALLANIKAGRTVQGGSTLTQQLVKNLYLDSERSLVRKINEAFMSLLLELHHDKRTILQTYLNEIYLGQDGGRAIHGFGLASEFYFRKPLAALDYDQMALLVAIVKGASYYHPQRHPERAMQRRNSILKTMRDENLLSSDQYDVLKNRPVTVSRYQRRGKYPAFLQLVKRQLAKLYDEDDLQAEGLNVYTTMDPWIQSQSETAIKKSLKRDFSNRSKIETASVTASHRSGDVLAIVGGSDPGFPGFNRALDARRQTGSLIKPVVYLAALGDPSRFTLASKLDDSEISLTNELGQVWTPQNYDREFHGDIMLFDALLKSYNVPAVRAGLDIGLGVINRTWLSLGGQHALPRLPSITLGAVEASPFEIAGIYQTLAAEGFDTPLNSVYAVLDSQGEPLTRNSIEVHREIPGQAISLVNYGLLNVTRSGTARRLSSELDIDVAGKTGTSDDTRDSWFAGFSGKLVTVVWMGYDNNASTGLTGSSGAMRLWSAIMQRVATESYQLRLPADVQMMAIDRDTGLLAGNGCENTVELPFIAGSQPQQEAPCVSSGSGSWFDNLFGD